MSDEEGFYEPKRGGDYYTVSGEHIVKKVPEGTDNCKSRINKMGKTVWEIHKEAYRGKINSVYIKKSDRSDFGDELCIRFGKATIQMGITSQHAQSFICKLRNIDLDEQLEFIPYKMARTDKPNKFNVGVTLKQNGKKLENHLDPKKGGDLPPLIERIKAGKKDYDSTDKDNFLYDHLVAWIEEQQFPDHTSHAETATDEEEDGGTAAAEEEEEDTDDIPY